MWREDLAEGKYKYIERYTDPLTEKTKRVSITLNSKSNQAQKQAQRLLSEKINNKLKKRIVTDLTIEQLIDTWWIQHKKTIRQSSSKIYEKVIRYIKGNLEMDVLIRNVDVKFLQDFINELPHSTEYNKKIKGVLNQAFKYAVDIELLDVNPMARVKVLRKAVTSENFKKTEEKYLEKDEMDVLLKAFYSRFQSAHFGRLAEFMYLTGVRFGEAVAITINDVNLKDKYVEINGTLDYSDGYANATKQPPKTASSLRKVSLPNRALEIVYELIFEYKIKYQNVSEEGYLFVGKTGKPIQLNSFNNSLLYINEKLGKDKINKNLSSHIFRHSHISLLAELNINIRAIMERVGHADSDTTMKIYTHVTKKSRSDIIDKLNSL